MGVWFDWTDSSSSSFSGKEGKSRSIEVEEFNEAVSTEGRERIEEFFDIIDELVDTIGALVHQAVKNVLIAQNNNEDTKAIINKWDKYTIDLKIPTKLGIVKSLPVRKLLMC